MTAVGGLARRWARGLRVLRRGEGGYAAVLVAVVVSTIGIGCAAVGVDTAMWYVEVQKVQKAADAAALGGVPYLPHDVPAARTRAEQIAERNGYDDDGTTNTVTAELGARATQLKVTISSTIPNQFGTMLGIDEATITRSAMADYQGPAPMGSPCNTFGNEPSAGGGGSSATAPHSSGSALGASSTIPVNCTRTPSFWANIEGPETGKVQGDRYQTKGCEDYGVDGCSGLTNEEYDEFGYVFLVKVQPSMFYSNGTPKSDVTVQLYDPQFLNTGQTCGLLPSRSNFGDNTYATNPYVRNNDARNRYSRDGSTSDSFCTGDSFPGDYSNNRMVTSFVLRQQTDTQDPKLAPVQRDTSGANCIKQYGGLSTTRYSNGSFAELPASVFKEGSGSYLPALGRTFHNWTPLCKFTPNRPGDYYVQVRTNVSLGGDVEDGILGEGNLAAAAKNGNTTRGSGSNAFAMRAVVSSGNERSVSLSGFDHMPIYVNEESGTAEFNLIRVLPGAAGQKISFSYFDAGDAAGAGSVKVVRPTDATGSITSNSFPGGCTSYGGSSTGSQNVPQSLSGCTAPFVKSSWQTNSPSKNNGKTQTITIPIPADYNCNALAFTGCWYKVEVSFGSGSVTDVTTWDAVVIGDPVRLVE